MTYDPVRRNSPYDGKPDTQTLTPEDFKESTTNLANDLHNMWNSGMKRCVVGTINFIQNPLIADGDHKILKQYVGPFTLLMDGTPDIKLPEGSIPDSFQLVIKSPLIFDNASSGNESNLWIGFVNEAGTEYETQGYVYTTFDNGGASFVSSGSTLIKLDNSVIDSLSSSGGNGIRVSARMESISGTMDIVGGTLLVYMEYYPGLPVITNGITQA